MNPEITIAEFGDDRPDGKTYLIDFCDEKFWEKMKEVMEWDEEMIKYYEQQSDIHPKNMHFQEELAAKYRRWLSEPRGAGYKPGKK